MITDSFYSFLLPHHDDERGKMCVAEYDSVLPFIVKRIFYDYDNKLTDSVRGIHANRTSRFVFICVNGSCSITADDGNKKETFLLDDPTKALYMDKMVWKEIFNYTVDCVLVVLSDSLYDKNEYIRDYESFINEKKGKILWKVLF